MEIERIKKVIVDQKEELREFFQREKIIEREIGAEKAEGKEIIIVPLWKWLLK